MMRRSGCPTLATVVAFLLITCPPALGERGPDALTPSARPEIYRDSWIDLNKNGSRDVYEDTGVPIDERIDDLLGQMTVTEKACQLATLYGFQRVLKDDLPTEAWHKKVWKDGIANIDEHINGIAGWRGMRESSYVGSPAAHARAMNEVQRWFVEQTRLGIPVDFTNEGLRGVCYLRATNFPAQVGVGATWNPVLVREIGRVTGIEARAVGYTNIYSPVLDVACDPRWGRVVECYGEDPFLVGRMGAAQAQGLREAGVGSTLKHYAVYSVPKGGRDDNARTDPHVAPREMQQIFLEPFATVIREADPVGVMCSYNDYDGVPLAANQNLLIDELRHRMGFRGYVVSDSDAVVNLWNKHRVATSHQDSVRLFLENGGNVRTEFNSPEKFIRDVIELVKQQKLSLDVVDERVRDVLRVKMELGLFDRPFVEQTERADELVNSEAHGNVALEAARQSMVLLKNENGVLPLAKNLSSILVCGPNAASTGHSICRYGPVLGEVISVVDGIRAVVSDETEVKYALGCQVVDKHWPESEIFPEPRGDDEQALIDEAVELAADVDAIVLVLGESEHTIGESKSRTSLELTGYQNDLAKALHATGKPVIVVLINGRALAINWIDRYVPAVIDAWFPGQACGQAVAEVLFGVYNPGGKLPVTFPRTVGQVPFSFPFKPGSHAGQSKGHNPNGVGNSRIISALYPFGFGLSYTEFEYDGLEIAPENVAPTESIQVSCRVTNVGKRTGDEVVQLYLRDDVSSVTTYDSVLRGFERITLKPGESHRVSFTLTPASLELINQDMQRVVEPGSFTVMVGSSSEDIRLKGSFQVRSASGDSAIAAKHVQN